MNTISLSAKEFIDNALESYIDNYPFHVIDESNPDFSKIWNKTRQSDIRFNSHSNYQVGDFIVYRETVYSRPDYKSKLTGRYVVCRILEVVETDHTFEIGGSLIYFLPLWKGKDGGLLCHSGRTKLNISSLFYSYVNRFSSNKVHEIMVLSEDFAGNWNNTKTFHANLENLDINISDTVVMREIVPSKGFTERYIIATVTEVTPGSDYHICMKNYKFYCFRMLWKGRLEV